MGGSWEDSLGIIDRDTRQVAAAAPQYNQGALTWLLTGNQIQLEPGGKRYTSVVECEQHRLGNRTVSAAVAHINHRLFLVRILVKVNR